MFCQVCWTGNRWQQRCFSVFLGEEFVPHARRSDKLERSVWCVSAVPMQMCLASMVYRQKQDYQDSPMMVPVQNAGNHREPKDRNLQAYLEKASEIGPGRRYPWPWRGVLRLTAETRKQTWPITLSRPQRIAGPSDQLKV